LGVCDADLGQQVLAVDERARLQQQRHRIQLAVVPGIVEQQLGHLGLAEHGLVERREHLLLRERRGPAHAHHHQVGRGATGDLGRELLVELVPRHVVDLEGDARVLLGELLEDAVLEVGLAHGAREIRGDEVEGALELTGGRGLRGPGRRGGLAATGRAGSGGDPNTCDASGGEELTTVDHGCGSSLATISPESLAQSQRSCGNLHQWKAPSKSRYPIETTESHGRRSSRPKTTSCCGVNAALFGPSALSIGERMMPSSVHVEATLLGSVRCARGRLRQAASALRRLLP